ncbi:MAG: nitrilase-related carbon-nitrogen hydrolase, partial [Arenicella sp.]|nr:nitrilase-related carbon-nitrogen hydrolase [Arenicella sp.]
NTQLLYSPDGSLANAHRKLIPTNTEKLVWGQGDGSDLAAVDMGFGKVGGLICFEHQMTLARYAMCSLGEQIHCGQWPGHAHVTPMIDASMRQLAHENGCFVVSAREVMSVDRLPKGAPDAGDDSDRWYGVGGSAIIAPNATNIATAPEDEEVLLTAEIDLSMIDMIKYHIDNVGHYSRPDVFQLFWDDNPKPPVLRASEVEANDD